MITTILFDSTSVWNFGVEGSCGSTAASIQLLERKIWPNNVFTTDLGFLWKTIAILATES